jgi:hypothetical protein
MVQKSKISDQIFRAFPRQQRSKRFLLIGRLSLQHSAMMGLNRREGASNQEESDA